MTTYRDLIPTDIFCAHTYIQEYEKNEGRQAMIIIGSFLTLLCICIPFFADGIMHDPANKTPPTLTTVIMFTTIMTSITMIFTGLLGYIFINIIYAMIDAIFPFDDQLWHKRYRQAWTSSIKPEMISSISKFQRFADTLPESAFNKPEYITMYELSEAIKREIDTMPLLNTTLKRMDTVPKFVRLTTMIDAYRTQRRIT